jgi:hypothetical protein
VTRRFGRRSRCARRAHDRVEGVHRTSSAGLTTLVASDRCDGSVGDPSSRRFVDEMPTIVEVLPIGSDSETCLRFMNVTPECRKELRHG